MSSSAASLWPTLAALQTARWLDLTHTFDESIPHCESFAPMRREILFHYDTGVGTMGSGILAHS
jgi:kynurenine formamidase